MSAPPKAAYVMSELHLSGFRVILGYDTLAEAQDAQAALSSDPTETVGEIDAMFWKWLGERGLQPDPEMNGTVDWLDIITALDEHERELLRPVPVDASAAKGEAVTPDEALYGLLWRTTTDDLATHSVRRDALNRIGGLKSEGQRRAIAWVVANFAVDEDAILSALTGAGK